MSFAKHLVGPAFMLGIFIVLTILGVATGGAGWVALSLLCAWPMFFAVSAWTFRGLKDSYRLVPKQAQNNRGRNMGVPEVLGG